MQTPWNINLFKFSSVLFRDLDNTVKLSGLDSGLNEDRLGYCAKLFVSSCRWEVVCSALFHAPD